MEFKITTGLVILGLISIPYSLYRLGISIKRLVKGEIEAQSGIKSIAALFWLFIMILGLPLSILFFVLGPFGQPIILLLQIIWLILFEVSLHFGFKKTNKLSPEIIN